jgi:hypothetical protein
MILTNPAGESLRFHTWEALQEEKVVIDSRSGRRQQHQYEHVLNFVLATTKVSAVPPQSLLSLLSVPLLARATLPALEWLSGLVLSVLSH